MIFICICLRGLWCASHFQSINLHICYTATVFTVYPKKYAHGFCFAVLCCGYTLTDFPISIRLTSLALWQSNDCPSASNATLMDMDKYFLWINYERLHNHNKAKHNKTVCIFLWIYCIPCCKFTHMVYDLSCCCYITIIMWSLQYIYHIESDIKWPKCSRRQFQMFEFWI